MNPVRLLVASIAFAALLTAGKAQNFELHGKCPRGYDGG